MTLGRLLKHCGLALLYFVTVSFGQTSTTLISVTRTTTVRVTATDDGDACRDFYGACVVYGDGNAAGYTTTVFRYAPSTSPAPSSTPVVTSTTTLLATTTASNSDACRGYTGACVVYGGSENGGAASSTAYYAGSGGHDDANNDGHDGLGNGGGYIAAQGDDDGGDGQLGGTAGAMALKRCAFEALAGSLLAIGVACLLI